MLNIYAALSDDKNYHHHIYIYIILYYIILYYIILYYIILYYIIYIYHHHVPSKLANCWGPPELSAVRTPLVAEPRMKAHWAAHSKSARNSNRMFKAS